MAATTTAFKPTSASGNRTATGTRTAAGSKTATAAGFVPFDFDETLLRGIREAGFENPRPIQAETMPAALDGRDVLGLAQTGTGKTAAFALPLLQYLLDEPGDRHAGPRVLVIAPTRELATQIAAEITLLARFTRIKVATVFGGVAQSRQESALRRHPEIVVGCPGRVLDLYGQKVLRLSNVESLVLDEADHMFDMGFLPDVRRILSALPAERQNLLFSATMPREVRGLADDLLHEPHLAELADAAPASTIDHALYPVAEHRKRDLLAHLLGGEDCDSAIVFTRTKHRARQLAIHLEKSGHRAVALQGNMSQAQRDRAMQGFRERRFDVLVATDIAARGIDVQGISHVINFDVPNTPEAYTHRIGRTGRSECSGIACTFVTGADHAWVRATERMIGTAIARRQVAGFEAPPEERPQPRHAKPAGPNGGRGGRRSSGRPPTGTAGPRSGGQRRGNRRPATRGRS